MLDHLWKEKVQSTKSEVPFQNLVKRLQMHKTKALLIILSSHIFGPYRK